MADRGEIEDAKTHRGVAAPGALASLTSRSR